MVEKVNCPHCHKTIAVGRWIGTLHFCVTAEQRARNEASWSAMRNQQEMIARVRPYNLDQSNLRAERDALRNAQSHTYTERGFEIIIAHDLEDQRDALLAERDRLREALEWVERNGGFAHPANTVAIARAALKGGQT